MNYEVIRQNDDNTVQVRMTIGDHVLEQAFDATDLDTNVKQGMAVFQSELDRNIPQTVDVTNLIGQVQEVAVLPTIPPEDLVPEPVAEPVVTPDPTPETTPQTDQTPTDTPIAA